MGGEEYGEVEEEKLYSGYIMWDKILFSIKEKQELITSYIDNIEVMKNDKDIKIKHINVVLLII